MKRILEWIKKFFEKSPPVYESYDIGRTEVTVTLYDGTSAAYWVEGALRVAISLSDDFYSIKYSETLAKDTVLSEGKSGFIGVSPDKYINIRDVASVSFKTISHIVTKKR